ncbi:unnamed protein product [Prorocentrum cordatum]|uniref:Protein kinase domain-containing protein n=1 Tax=Prorocentrum cordatum TaxID=2364126 RepID=A0ABN9QNW8_9DINO|nr:unnamed protein product [Polarella glacialis]
MAASPGEGCRGPPRRGKPWLRCSWARFENGIDRLTLRFQDPMQEEGYANTHKEKLSHYVAVTMVSLIVVSLLTVLAHRFWDDAQYPTKEAVELSRWQAFFIIGSVVCLNIALGTGRLLARYNIVGTLGLEIIVVSANTCLMIVLGIIPKHYMARVFGYRDTEAIWGVDLAPTDGNLVLYIDMVVTCLHCLLPIRWVVLVPLELLAILAYAAPALLLGSPAMNMVLFNIVGLLALIMFSAIGKRAFERQERALFAGLLSEKQMRFQAEFELSKVDSRDAAKPEDLGSEVSAPISRPGTTMSAAAFDGGVEHASLDLIRAIGEREQWLIAGGEVELLPDRVLGEGGFGIVALGVYHNTLVAVKAPKENIASTGFSNSSLPALCNELRILRRIRHPNIAFLYGACMDIALSKLCLVLEFVDGVPLRAFVHGLSPGAERAASASPGVSDVDSASSAATKTSIIFDVLNVLRYLHSREPVVVHGDLKDSNVIVEERRSRSGRSSYHAKLLDFGLSRIVTRRATPLGGTLRWMAPELLSRKPVPPDVAADCYSLGLLTYYIVTARFPFEGRRAEEVLRRLRRGQPPRLAWPAPADDLAQACRPLVEQCTQPKPALRPAAQQVSDELSTLLDWAVGGAMEAVGQGASPAPSAAGSPAIEEPQEFKGVLELRQAGSSSVSLLGSGAGFRSLPSVQEQEVLSGEAPGGGAAARTAAGSAPGEPLAHPDYQPTPLSTQTLTLAYLMMQWNVPKPAGACCWLHGSLRSLDRVRRKLGRRACSGQQEAMLCGQCGTCGLLLMDQSSCDFCDCPGASGSASAAAGGPADSEGEASI